MPINPDLPITPLTQQPTLREAVTQSLYAAIVSGALDEGLLYSAPVLGAALGVSATPVREAMMDLSREGFVERVKNKGFRITGLTKRAIREITEIRLLIEPIIVAGLAGRIPASALSELNGVANRALASAEAADLPGFQLADRDFHSEILRHHGNEELVKLATNLHMRTRLTAVKSLNDSDLLIDHAREHVEIVRLLESGDSSKAKHLMGRHVSQSGRGGSEEREESPNATAL
ncbi:GntR family transcriptional regulator [Sinomonas terrae]|uniref:GntR family transcriptional regulator n=1 Tax=Sinomonas terrae TaxID=2908838 RepID=A0ABS9U764_9MICC|nr:GntR family transcriptional regulator [Sinomonas terrae]MCH6472538.1 GntR family transcriptional regulator [Sinomonas terrae]